MWLGTTNQSALFHHTKVIFMTQDSRTNYFVMKGLAVRYGNNLRHSNLLNCAKRFGKNWSKCGFQNILITVPPFESNLTPQGYIMVKER